MKTPALPPDLIFLERGWLSANNIVLSGPERTALVDTGYHTHAAQTTALVGRALNGRPLELLVNTHLHSDHCGGNAALQAAHPALHTFIPPGHADQVRNWDANALSYEPTGQHCPRFAFDDVLRPDTSIRLGAADWQVHAAPGHDPHSVLLFEPASHTLISADALWQNGFGVVFPEVLGEEGFDDVAATLDLIERLNPRTVIPGHGAIFDDVGAALQRARTRLDGFVKNPKKHAAHAAKVLLKFKLLEWQRTSISALTDWALAARFVALLHDRHFSELPATQWIGTLVDDLVRVGAARREDGWVVDAG